MSNTSATRRNVLLGATTLASASALGGGGPEFLSQARAEEIIAQRLIPSPDWASALPPGPDTSVKITEACARMVAWAAYFWTWPMVNILHQQEGVSS
jgi:hypothetical protein